MNSLERFLKASRFENVDRPPVWMMRQAGRTLPEYRSLREKHSFWKICRTPELATEVTLQPIRRFPIDAAVIFSDILVIPDAMGLEVSFTPKLSISPVIQTAADVDRLDVSQIEKQLDYVAETIRCVNREIGSQKAVLGFSGAPFTISSYMIEGGGSRHFIKVREMMYRQTQLFLDLQEKLVQAISMYLILQAKASATAVQLFDTWAGELNPKDYSRFVQPFVKSIIENVKKCSDIPVIYYINGIGNLLSAAASTGADVIGVDWRMTLTQVRQVLGDKTVVQGNLDPALLFAPEDEIRQRVRQMIAETNGLGHIVNLGHGLIPESPLSGIEAFIETVIEWKPANIK